MEFRITTHTGRGAPADAIESLWRHLQERTSRTRYSQRGRNEIRASSGYDEARQAIREERMERERRAVLEAVREVCDLAPELESDWYAVGPVD
jgi:hypothetical protein